MNAPTPKDGPFIDDYLFAQNIEFLCDCFPRYEREEILNKICEFNFDINNVVSNILNETYQDIPKSEENLKYLNAEDIHDILANCENIEEINSDYDFLEMQNAIENSIKKNKEEDYDMEKNCNEMQNNEEFFLNKKIRHIQNPQIKKDDSSDKEEKKNFGLKILLNSKYKEVDHTKKKKVPKNVNNNQSQIDKRRYDTFKKILENKPINWKIEHEKNINEKDYIAIRNRLYREANNFFANKKYKEGQLLLSKAKRYQQEIEQIARNRGIREFFNNNSYNNNSKEIDLHGLNLKESKLIINKKLQQLEKKKLEDNLKSISFTIITGKGSHSEEYKPVLYPELLYWLKKKELQVKGVPDEGIIYVTIY